MPVSPNFAHEYADALRHYIDGGGEEFLSKAYDLGRRALGEDVGLLELAGLHGESVRPHLATDNAAAAERASRFLVESLAPFEMTHRGFREANTALRDLTDTLEQRVADRTEAAETARQQAEDANRAKSDFLAVMSHELRTPLNAVLGYADLLDAGVSGALNPTQLKQVAAITSSARHLLEMIEEILAFAKIESGTERVNLEHTNLAAVIEDAAALVRPAAAARNLDFTVELPSGDIHARTDSRKVRQILVNLLSNAVKFTERGSITLRARTEDNWIIIDVEDTGIGIPAEHLEHIFDAFWQVERTTTRTTGGTGLGLSVSRSIARQLGGEVTVESTVGKGSRFTVRLPLWPRAKRDAPAPE